MKLLLDTHIALWWLNEHEKLPFQVKDMLLNNEHARYISMASAWEIAIKVSTGRLAGLSGGVSAFLGKINQMPISVLSITSRHLEIVETLPFIHRDPFDRLLVATAKADGMTILTADENIKKYDVPSAWC